MGSASGTYGREEMCYRVLVGKPEGKRPLGRPSRRWEDITKMVIREVGWGGMHWIDLAQEPQVADSSERGDEPLGSTKCGEFLE